MKKIISLVLAAALLSLTLFACVSCGGSKQVKVIDIALTEEEYAFGVDKNQPELLAQVNDFIAKIQSNGQFDAICAKYFEGGTPEGVASATLDATKDQLVVATNAGFEPFEYKEGNLYYGIDMEIAKLLADELGKELVILNMDFEAVCLSVQQGKADIAMAGLTVKPEREEMVSFSNTYYNASQKLVVLADDTRFDECKTVADVEAVLKTFDSSVKADCQGGTTGQFYCEGDADWGFNGFAMETKGYKNGSLAVQDLLNGNIQYVIIDSAPAACITEAINKLQ